MGNIKLQEATVDGCIQKTMHVLETRFVSQERTLDLAEYIRYAHFTFCTTCDKAAAFGRE